MRSAVVALLVSVPSVALAQSDPNGTAPQTTFGPSLGPPKITWIGQGDANGPAGVSLFEPLRLAVMGDAPPIARAQGIRCEDYPEASGSLTGSPNFAQPFAAAFAIAPRLTLVGFARDGCPIDAVASVGLVHVMPIRPNIFLATSAGYLVAPHQGPGDSVVKQAHLRADVVFRRASGRTFSLGIGHTNITTQSNVSTRTGLTFGGVL